jgi:hypothetical protein
LYIGGTRFWLPALALQEESMTYKPTSGASEPTKKTNTGLRSDDGRHSDLQDRRHGAYDRVVEKPAHPMKQHMTAHEAAQRGGAVQPETEQIDEAVPEGLRRERMSAINPHTGRGGVPSHVPGGKPGRG